MRRIALVYVALVCISGRYAALPQQAAQSQPSYFPPRAFATPAPRSRLPSRLFDGSLQEGWFGSQLLGLQEPPLVGRSSSDEPVYRFTLLPSFNHPVAVRVTIHQNGTGTVITTVGKGYGGYAPKGLLTESSAEIGPNIVKGLRDAITRSRFWELPTEPNKQQGSDGTEWLLEAADPGRYHVVDRWEGADLRKLGLFFLYEIGNVGSEANLSSALE